MAHFMTRTRLLLTRNSTTYPTVFAGAVPTQSSKLSKTLKMDSQSKRPTCPTCFKPCWLCLCRRVPSPCLDNPVSVTILQHSLERKHALNSTRIARLGLRNVSVTTVFDVDCEAQFVIRINGSDSESSCHKNGAKSSICDQWLENGNFLQLGRQCVDDSCKLVKAAVDDLEIEKNVNFVVEEKSNLCVDRRSYPKRQKIDQSLRNSRNSDELACGYESVAESQETDGTVVDKNPSNGNVLEDSISEQVIQISMRKNGVISHASHSLMLKTQEDIPDLEHLLVSHAAMDALAKGFIVTKFSEENQEFKFEVPPRSVLLFPSEESVTVADLKATGFKPRNLIVLDGTWAKAKRMYLENPWLKLLQHVRLDLEATSLYGDVRRQPKVGCLSTIESIVHAMKEIGDCPDGLDNLLDVFESMIEDQRRCKDERLGKISESR